MALMFPLPNLFYVCMAKRPMFSNKMEMKYRRMTIKRVSRKAFCFSDEAELLALYLVLFFVIWAWHLKQQQPLHFSSMEKNKKIWYGGFNNAVTNYKGKNLLTVREKNWTSLKIENKTNLWITFSFPCCWKFS